MPAAVAAGIATVTVKAQAAPGPRLPPVKLTVDVPVTAEPAPQTPASGRLVAAAPATMPARLSEKANPDTVSVALTFVRVKVKFTVPPATAGPANALLNWTRKIFRVSLAEPPTTGRPPRVPLIVDVVLSAVPPVAPAGTSTVTSKKQEPPAARLPPDKTIVAPPSGVVSVPPQAAIGRPRAFRPLRAASRSSLKAIAEIGSSRSRLSIVKRRFTVPPGVTGSSVNSLVRNRRSESTVRASTAGGRVVGVDPTVAVRSLVVLG